MEKYYMKPYKTKKCWFYKMGSYFDLAITQPIFRLGLKIMIFLKSELNGLLKMPQIALLHISEAEK